MLMFVCLIINIKHYMFTCANTLYETAVHACWPISCPCHNLNNPLSNPLNVLTFIINCLFVCLFEVDVTQVVPDWLVRTMSPPIITFSNRDSGVPL